MNSAIDRTTLKAAVLMVCAMAIIGVIDNLIPRIADQIGLWQFHFTRAVLALPLVAALSLTGLGGLRPRRWWAVAARSLLVALSMMFYFSALAIMPIAQALAGLFTSPIFILLITALFMRQPVGPWRIMAVGIGFAGILFVLQPDPADFDLAVLIPVAAGFFYALGAISTRTLCAGESALALLMGMWLALGAFGALGVVALALFPVASPPGAEGFVTRGWVWPMWQAAPWVVVQVLGAVSAVFLITRAYQMGEPSHVGVFEYSVMLFGPVFAWVAFGQPVTGWQMVGIVLIAGAGAIIAIRAR